MRVAGSTAQEIAMRSVWAAAQAFRRDPRAPHHRQEEDGGQQQPAVPAREAPRALHAVPDHASHHSLLLRGRNLRRGNVAGRNKRRQAEYIKKNVKTVFRFVRIKR